MLPGNGGPHAIFLPRQKRHASGGFFSGEFLDGRELKPIDGDFGEFRRNSVGGGVVWQDATCDGSDGSGWDWPLSIGELGGLGSDNRSRRITPSWQLLVNFKVGGFI